jgi:ankyrin repeat protein
MTMRSILAVTLLFCLALMAGCTSSEDGLADPAVVATVVAAMESARAGYAPIELLQAIESQDVGLVKVFLEQGVDVNLGDYGDFRPSECGQPIHIAARVGCVEIAKLLIEHGADVNAETAKYNDFPLHLAAKEGHLEVVRLLIDNGADVNRIGSRGAGWSALSLAERYGHNEVAAYLLENGGTRKTSDI